MALSDRGTSGAGKPPGGGSAPMIDNRYRVIRLLGRGGQGEVYLAHDQNLDIEVAVKLLHAQRKEQFIERFAHEARLIARLDSPNIVHIYDFNPSYPYIVMEYCGDGDLNHLIKSRRPLELLRIVALIRQICNALIVAHERENPILHRDLKPGNVLFKNDVPKVADFGLAKVRGDTSGMTSTRVMMGTFGYASPEQIRDAAGVDQRTDLWAVGVMAYELLTFRSPFESPGDDDINVAIKVRSEDPADPHCDIPAPLWQFVLRALEKDPASRFASAREMVQALEQALALIPDASRLRFPPDDALAEADRLASRIAESFTSGSSERVASLIDELRRIAPEDKLVSYWERRVEDASQDAITIEPRTLPIVSRETLTQADDSYGAIESLMAVRDYDGAVRECGKMLMKDPGDSRVQELRERITVERAAYSRRLEEVRRQAELAHGSGDVRQALRLWEQLDDELPGSPDVMAEIAFKKSELAALEQQERRVRAERDVASLRAAGDLAGAIKVWDDHLEACPSDSAAAATREKLRLELETKRRAERRKALWEEADELRRAGRLDAALAVLDRWLGEQPGDERFIKAAESLRVEIADRRMAERLDATRREASSLAGTGELDAALRLWQTLLGDYPTQPEARKEAALLEAAIEQRHKDTLAREIRVLADALDARLQTGRYASLDAVVPDLQKRVAIARQTLDGGLPALGAARQALADGGTAAEGILGERLAAARAELRERVARAFEQLDPADEDCSSTEPTAAEDRLRADWESAVGVLGEASSPDSAGDPLARVDRAALRLEEALATLESERSEAIQASLARAQQALRQAEASVDALQAVPDLCGQAVDQDELKARLSDLGAQLESRSVARLSRLAGEAVVVETTADVNRIAALLRLREQLKLAVAEGLELVPLARGARLFELLQAAAVALDQPPEAGPTAAELVSARDGLIAEIAVQRDQQDAAAAHAASRWSAACAVEPPPGESVRIEQIKHAGSEALATQRFDDVERHAARMEGLGRRGWIEASWDSSRAAVRELEGPADEDGVVVGPTDPGSQDLLREYREAVARADVDRLSRLERRLADADADAEGDGGTGEIPVLSARARKLNQRYRPDVLASFDRQPSERSFAMLLQPTPAWWRWAPIVATLVLAGAAYAFWPTPGPDEVRLVSPEGEARVAGLTRDGAEWVSSSNPMTITPEGVVWKLEPGSYELKLTSGVSVPFEVPAQRRVLIPGPGVDPVELIREFQLEGDLP